MVRILICNDCSSELPYMKVQDLRRELETYRKLKMMIKIFCMVLTGLSILAITFCISSQMLFKTRLNLKKYMLLRINGLSIKKINYIIVIQALLLGITGIMLSILPTIILVQSVFHLNLSSIKKFLITPELLNICVCLFPLVIMAVLPSIMLIYRTRVKEIL